MYKCLALPGWSNDAEIMKQLCKQFEEATKGFIKIEYLDPSYEVKKSMLELPAIVPIPEIPGKTVYRWGDKYCDMKKDVNDIRNRILLDPTIVGVIGFSHGTFLIGELGQLTHSDKVLRQQLKFFVVFTSNGQQPNYNTCFNKKLIKIPTIQTIGTRDPLELNALFQSTEYLDPLIIYTSATHRVPIFNYEELKQIIVFLKKSLNIPNL